MNLQRLKELRLEHGYTQQQLATHMDMSQTTYSDKEKGKTPFTIPEFEKLHKFLGEEVLELLELQ
ncbi:TPA: helix-turn-helix transcriptional regulator [Clostridioides difficile]|uniref:helix-turn-helix domain-containing protein n=1 Tax=Clostridioides TaxID=1870884 RepID=UPI00038D7F0C|nr:helix-turn-helix transcriptional regulator [Clostridioides difficile]MCC0698541.1 helix-turn-helix transcriptional regulator [Clostridioides sp. ZZV15-6383]AWH83433.1 XRE family transcriptional regulator [Clostridioides difficile]EGT5015175.1 XRE family transcriptional regulator [Clostridioides difficile]EGT5447448.1 XRE family transcriptional regulator [Clostridioides difficile]EJX3365449.1 helix-turn-helix transcriptional regulator [Clostridioides difficile]